jgi:hypothetical protein
VTVDARQRRVIIILSTALVCLWGARFGQNLADDSWSHLTQMCFWAGTQIFFYLVVPFVVVRFSGGHRRLENLRYGQTCPYVSRLVRDRCTVRHRG